MTKHKVTTAAQLVREPPFVCVLLLLLLATYEYQVKGYGADQVDDDPRRLYIAGGIQGRMRERGTGLDNTRNKGDKWWPYVDTIFLGSMMATPSSKYPVQKFNRKSTMKNTS